MSVFPPGILWNQKALPWCWTSLVTHLVESLYFKNVEVEGHEGVVYILHLLHLTVSNIRSHLRSKMICLLNLIMNQHLLCLWYELEKTSNTLNIESKQISDLKNPDYQQLWNVFGLTPFSVCRWFETYCFTSQCVDLKTSVIWAIFLKLSFGINYLNIFEYLFLYLRDQ